MDFGAIIAERAPPTASPPDFLDRCEIWLSTCMYMLFDEGSTKSTRHKVNIDYQHESEAKKSLSQKPESGITLSSSENKEKGKQLAGKKE